MTDRGLQITAAGDQRRRLDRGLAGQGPDRPVGGSHLSGAGDRASHLHRRDRSRSASRSATKAGGIRRPCAGRRGVARRSSSIPTPTSPNREAIVQRRSPIRPTRFTRKRCCAARRRTSCYFASVNCASEGSGTTSAIVRPGWDAARAISRTGRKGCSSPIWISARRPGCSPRAAAPGDRRGLLHEDALRGYNRPCPCGRLVNHQRVGARFRAVARRRVTGVLRRGSRVRVLRHARPRVSERSDDQDVDGSHHRGRVRSMSIFTLIVRPFRPDLGDKIFLAGGSKRAEVVSRAGRNWWTGSSPEESKGRVPAEADLRVKREAATELADLLRSVAAGRVSATDAIALIAVWPDGRWPPGEPSFSRALHLLHHCKDDSRRRERDHASTTRQITSLEGLAKELEALARRA